jgi:hypothetical protein
MFRHKTSKTGMIKSFGSFSYDACRMLYPNFQESVLQDIALKNHNSYLNTTYIEELNSNWVFQSGIAANFDVDQIQLDQHTIKTTKKSGQAKISFINQTLKNVKPKWVPITSISISRKI